MCHILLIMLLIHNSNCICCWSLGILVAKQRIDSKPVLLMIGTYTNFLLITCTTMLNYQKRIQYFLYILVHTSFRHQTILAWIEWISSTMLEKWRLFTSYRIFIVLLKNVARNELQSFLCSCTLFDLYRYVI